MITKNQLTNTFAIFTIVTAVIHFVLETLYTIEFGQNWAGILPDYIAVCLMFLGGISVLKNIKMVGILCGAWGFTFCLHYRAWAWRYYEISLGTSSTLVEDTMNVLLYTMFISVIAFVISLVLCYKINY
tara:strand:- start:418 stop:804 length:387 start_codon:yes stop_codon:yes gene_type:complete